MRARAHHAGPASQAHAYPHAGHHVARLACQAAGVRCRLRILCTGRLGGVAARRSGCCAGGRPLGGRRRDRRPTQLHYVLCADDCCGCCGRYRYRLCWRAGGRHVDGCTDAGPLQEQQQAQQLLRQDGHAVPLRTGPLRHSSG